MVSTITYGATTIGSNINTGGTLTATGATTIYGATSIGGAITATSTLTVTGLTTLGNASTTNLSTTGNLWINGFATTTSTGNIQGQGILTMLGTGTSTFSGGIQGTALNITTATASSTFANGIILSKGCFLMPDGTCAGAGGGGGTINSGTTGQFPYYAGSGTTLTATSSLFLSSNQNIGIGTTSPNWLLQVAGVRPFFTLSDTGAGTNNKHWFLSSQGGNFYVGTTTDAYATSTVSKLTILSNGNVGIGTTTPQSQFALSGDAYFAGNVGIGITQPSVALQVVGNYARIGDGGTVSFIDGDGDLYIEDELEVDGTAYLSSSYVFNNLYLESSGLNRVFWNNVDILHYQGVHLEMQESASDVSPVFIISDRSTLSVDLNFFDNVTDPSIAILSDDASKYSRLYTEDDGDFVIKTGTTTVPRVIFDTNGVGIGTTTPTVSFQVATSTANATTTIEVGKANQNKGSCLKMYNQAGTLTYCTIVGTTLSCSATSCE